MNRQYRLVNRSVPQKKPFPSPAFILAVLVLSATGYGFYRFADYLILESRMFRLNDIEVVGNRFVEEEDIIKLAELKPGAGLFQMSTDSVARRIMENPYLQGVSVSRSLPATVILSVRERQPVAYLIDKKVYMVDAYGRILLKKSGMSLNNLPLITGLSVRKLLQNREPLFRALDLIQIIKEVDSELFQFISELYVGEQTVPHIYLIRGGAKVELGENHLYRRIFLLSKFLETSAILNQLNSIEKIDLTFKNRIIVTRKS